MIEIINISKSFGDKKVLFDVSATFETGKTNLIIGASGQGKSVLGRCMVGLIEVDSGEISYDKRMLSDLDRDEKKKLRKDIGMLFQGTALFDSLTVEDNVRFPLDMFSSKSRKEKLERVNFCLERVDLKDVNHLFPGELSGGMRKRVGIARAIVQNPKYLFCDEPTSGLDPQTAIVIDTLIQEITKEFNITTVINTHDMNSVMELGEKIIFLLGGKKWWEGSKSNVLNSQNEELDKFIFASKFLRALKQSEDEKANDWVNKEE